MSCAHSPSRDPRRHGACSKCGRLPPPPVERDTALEGRVLTRAESLCETAFKARPVGYAIRVRDRMDGVGATSYGDLAFMSPDRDNLLEAAVEPLDVASYEVFWLQQRWNGWTQEQRELGEQKAAGIVAVAMWLWAQIEEQRKEDVE